MKDKRKNILGLGWINLSIVWTHWHQWWHSYWKWRTRKFHQQRPVVKAQRRNKLSRLTECKTGPETGEWNYNKTHVPFHAEAKVEIKPYAGEVDAIRLNQWLQWMQVYFNVHEVTKKQKIVFSWLKLEGHALTWWESDAVNRELGNEPLVIDWEVFKKMIKS
jgi:hypothetical protein